MNDIPIILRLNLCKSYLKTTFISDNQRQIRNITSRLTNTLSIDCVMAALVTSGC